MRSILIASAVLILSSSCTSCGADRSLTPAHAQEPVAEPPPGPDSRPSPRSPLGTNLDFPYDWSEAVPFVDAFRLSRPWASSRGMGQPDDNRPLALDEHGWVSRLGEDQIARSGVLWDVPHARGGRYTIRWRGSGRLITHGSATVVERGEGTMTVDFEPQLGSGLGLAIEQTDPDDPIRDIRVLPPGGACREDRTAYCEQSSDGCECLSFVEHHEELLFHPDFLRTMGIYSVIRFMNWQLINDSEHETWDDRPRLDDAQWARDGVPPEILAELCNRLGAHPWVHVPHRADDGYARELGRVMREHLDPSLRVRIELSNEVWNHIFAAWQWASDHGLELGLIEPDGDRGVAQIRWVAHRSVEIFAAFDEGFGDRDRVIHVLPSAAVNPWVTQVMFEYRDTAAHTDELAIAPYFGPLVGPDLRDEVRQGGVDHALDLAEESLEEVEEWIRGHVRLAREHDIPVVAYEGGQHLVGVGGVENDEAITQILHAANRHPRMGRLYDRYLRMWREAGGTLFVHFVNAGGWGRHGTWGALEHARQESSPKQAALERFVQENPPWW